MWLVCLPWCYLELAVNQGVMGITHGGSVQFLQVHCVSEGTVFFGCNYHPWITSFSYQQNTNTKIHLAPGHSAIYITLEEVTSVLQSLPVEVPHYLMRPSISTLQNRLAITQCFGNYSKVPALPLALVKLLSINSSFKICSSVSTWLTINNLLEISNNFKNFNCFPLSVGAVWIDWLHLFRRIRSPPNGATCWL